MDKSYDLPVLSVMRTRNIQMVLLNFSVSAQADPINFHRDLRKLLLFHILL